MLIIIQLINSIKKKKNLIKNKQVIKYKMNKKIIHFVKKKKQMLNNSKNSWQILKNN